MLSHPAWADAPPEPAPIPMRWRIPLGVVMVAVTIPMLAFLVVSLAVASVVDCIGRAYVWAMRKAF